MLKPIDDWKTIHLKYSVWVLLSIFGVSALEAAEPLFQPWVPVWCYPLLVAGLSVVGIVVRGIKQGGDGGDPEQH